MVLPVYLAMTGAEMLTAGEKAFPLAWMACHFSPYSDGITNLPASLPKGSMLILDDSTPCRGHNPELVAQQLCNAVRSFDCESVLLDFQREPTPESLAMACALVTALPCPTAVSAGYAENEDSPILLPPSPLHIPPATYLKPWNSREIWLEAALCQEAVTVTEAGTSFKPQFPPDGLFDGFFDETLCCNHIIQIQEDHISFTLFDTADTLAKKLSLASALGVSRFVGLYQELGNLPHNSTCSK